MSLNIEINAFGYDLSQKIKLSKKDISPDEVINILKDQDWTVQIDILSKDINKKFLKIKRPEIISITKNENLKLNIESWDHNIYSVNLYNEKSDKNLNYYGEFEFHGLENILKAITILNKDTFEELREFLEEKGIDEMGINKKTFIEITSRKIDEFGKEVSSFKKSTNRTIYLVYSAISIFILSAFLWKGFTLKNLGTALILIVVTIGMIHGFAWLDMKTSKNKNLP